MIADVHFEGIEEDTGYAKLINQVLQEAFQEEKLDKLNVYMNVILTTPEVIRTTNKTYRNIDKETDVLSFPMFEKNEIEQMVATEEAFPVQEVLGDIMVSIAKVEEQAKEYQHSFERELAYMIIHGFYHILGYDHMEEEEKKQMRAKEETVLNKLHITRE